MICGGGSTTLIVPEHSQPTIIAVGRGGLEIAVECHAGQPVDSLSIAGNLSPSVSAEGRSVQAASHYL